VAVAAAIKRAAIIVGAVVVADLTETTKNIQIRLFKSFLRKDFFYHLQILSMFFPAGRRFQFITIPLMLVFSACHQPSPKAVTVAVDTVALNTDETVTGNFIDQITVTIDSNYIRSFFEQFPLLKGYQKDLNEFYVYRNYHCVWYYKEQLTEQAGNLFNHLTNLGEEGINAKAPYIDSLDKFLNDAGAYIVMDPKVEALLTAEYFFYADKVWKGIPEHKTTKLEWLIPRKKLDLPHLTDSLLRDHTASIFSGSYNWNQYNLLKKELGKYKMLDTAGDWPILKTDKKSFKKTDSAQFIGQLRHRLFLLGDLSTDSHDNYFDDSLEAGIKSFQYRNGLKEDGMVGQAFIREINTPVKTYIRKLIVNMERTRWIPINLNKHYLIINIPAFTLTAYDNDTATIRMNVVVGKEVHKTTVFNGDIKYIVFSPYWNVPNSILKNEVLPGIKKNPDYLNKNNMEWVGNTVRQKPGPKNSLGLVKFLFPNSYNIYLHDSPAKSLFSAESRAFSHGCIRLSEPRKLAVYLLRDDPKWDTEKIDQAMHAGKEQYVTLAQPVPVYIGYMTAWVDRHGKLNFRKDIYNRDEALEQAMIIN
jgi:L,D-transpeptidase YcbB